METSTDRYVILQVSVTPPPLIPKQPLPLAIEPAPEHEGMSPNPSPTINNTYDSDNEGAESVDLSTTYSVQKSQTDSSQQQTGVFLTEVQYNNIHDSLYNDNFKTNNDIHEVIMAVI